MLLILVSVVSSILYGSQATETTELEPFARDPELDQSLSALLRRPVDVELSPLDVQLQRASVKCRELGVHTLVLSKKVRYVRQLREEHRKIPRELYDLHQHQEKEEEADAREKLQRTQGIVTRDVSDVDLQEFFEKYAETSQPVVLTPPPAAASEGSSSSEILGFASEEELIAFQEACFDLRTTKTAPLQLQTAKCREFLDHFRVPIFVAHNYVHRTSVSLTETFLPALVRVSANTNEIVTCPFGLHMLAMAMTEGSMAVDVFGQRFEPLFPHSRGGGVEEFEVSATSGGVLFVPGSKFATMRGAGTTASDYKLLRFCFVDASNFNAVKQELGVEALVNDEAHALLLSLLSPAFDRSMPRRVQPSDLLWTNYIAWPKETKFLKKSDLMNSEGGNEQLQLSRRIETLTLPVSLPPAVVNITRTTATLRWQDLYEPPKHDITPYGYILRWKPVGDDVPSSSSGELDAGANSMNITRKHIVRSALPTTLFGDDFDGHGIEGVVSGLAAETKYTLSVQTFVDDTLGLESYGSRVAQTSPCSEPSRVRGIPKASDLDTTCAKLRWLDPVDDGGKSIGLYLISMRQVQDSVDALVGAHDASQSADGEKVVTLDGRLAAPILKQDGWKSAQLCKMAPGATYFSVASSRRLSATNVPTLKGRGDPEYVPMHTFSVRELKDLITSHGSEVVVSTLASSIPIREDASTSARGVKLILSDVDEKIVLHKSSEDEKDGSAVTGSEISFDVWSAHYSPRAFHVSSEIVRADPLDASTPLRNADQAKDRIVLVSRGLVPFVFKVHYAQLAGALGVIIADVNDTCHGRFDQRCVPGGDKSRGEGFAAQDRHVLWEQNRIPCVLALREASHQLLELVTL
ncbi:Immunoglobulin-like fold, partial [Globisporangium splendens]